MCPSSPSRRAVGRSGSLPALVVHAPLASPPPFDRSCPCRPGPASFPLARPALPLPSRFLSPSSAPSSRYTLLDRKSTRLNSSHANISYAVFCLKKKNTDQDLELRVLVFHLE